MADVDYKQFINMLRDVCKSVHSSLSPTEAYANRAAMLLFSNLGLGSIPARNWVWEDAIKSGSARHWILDDNIDQMYQRKKSMRIPCDSSVAFACIEEFVDRYENIAIAGIAYDMFLPDFQKYPPFFLNVHVYSCLLIRNDLPFRWRGRYNEDTDLCLQALADGWCTVLVNAFCIDKKPTMTAKGGNTDELYSGDGRLKMARALQRQWPHLVTVDRKYGRPQHVVHQQWKRFTTPLIKKAGIKVDSTPSKKYDTKLVVVGKTVKSKRLKRLMPGEAE